MDTVRQKSDIHISEHQQKKILSSIRQNKAQQKTMDPRKRQESLDQFVNKI